MYVFACDLEDWEKEKFQQLENEHRVEFCSTSAMRRSRP
jgi:hypothetical protein